MGKRAVLVTNACCQLWQSSSQAKQFNKSILKKLLYNNVNLIKWSSGSWNKWLSTVDYCSPVFLAKVWFVWGWVRLVEEHPYSAVFIWVSFLLVQLWEDGVVNVCMVLQCWSYVSCSPVLTPALGSLLQWLAFSQSGAGTEGSAWHLGPQWQPYLAPCQVWSCWEECCPQRWSGMVHSSAQESRLRTACTRVPSQKACNGGELK